MKRVAIIVLLGFLGLLLVPVLLARFNEPEPRSFEHVRLEDTSYQEVSFTNHRQIVDIAGMLFVPGGTGPFPAVVIIHGSGTSRRDNGWYLTLTHYLQEQGIVVLLPDKRGSVKSGGDWRTASLQDLATDTAAAVDFLKNQSDVGISEIGVIGMSQGGLIAPIVADQMEELGFLVNIVGGAVPLHDLMLYDETHNLRQMGLLPGIADLFAYPASWSLIYLRQKEFWGAVGNFDPLPYWRNISTDSLVLLGENDTNVPSSRSAERLRELKKPNIEVKIYAGSGHALEAPEGSGNKIIREDALEDVRDFIIRTAGDG